MDLGDFAVGTTFTFRFHTKVAEAMTTLAGSPTLGAYKDTSTTEITAGLTLTVDSDSKVGMHLVTVNLASSASYSAGEYDLVLLTGTVGGVSQIGTVLAHFSIGRMPYPHGAVTSDAGNTSLAFTTNLSASSAQQWKRCLLLFTTGALAGQQSRISDFQSGDNRVTVIDAFTSTPATGDSFVIVNR